VLLAACAAQPHPAAQPSYAPIPLEPAPPHAALYGDCLADAIASHRVAHAADASTSLLVFTCRGAPARAFFDGLAAWSAQQHSEFVYGGRTFRSTARVRHDLFGVDYCSAEECVISFNAGDFVR
jgi:hypothetical protein